MNARYNEPWYLAYALLGVVTVGLVPIILPLWVTQSGTAAHVGLVMAMLNVGRLSSPLWATLAERYALHRALFVAGLGVVGASLTGLALTTTPLFWLLLALAQGVGAAAVATLANLLIVEAHPKGEWDARIGSLQTFFGGGQVLGLLVAGLVDRTELHLGLYLAAGLALTGLLFTRGLPAPSSSPPSRKRRSHHLPFVRAHLHAEPSFGSPTSHFYLAQLRRGVNVRALSSPVVSFLLLWFVLMTSSTMVSAFYPIWMRELYGLGSSVAAWGFAAAAAAGLLFYAPAARWAARYGARSVLKGALSVRVVAALALAVFALAPLPDYTSALAGALGPFTVFVVTWSLLSVSSTTLSVSFDLPQSEALGLYSAVSALAGVAGSLLGGAFAHVLGYEALLVAAASGLLVSALLMYHRGTGTGA